MRYGALRRHSTLHVEVIQPNLKWFNQKWNDSTKSEMIQPKVKWFNQKWNDSTKTEMIQPKVKWFNITWNDSTKSEMIQHNLKWFNPKWIDSPHQRVVSIRHRAMSTEINQARILTHFNPVAGKQTDWILSSFWISEVVLLKARQLTF